MPFGVETIAYDCMRGRRKRTAVHFAPITPSNDHYFPYFFFGMSTDKENTSRTSYLWMG